jgi:predicted RNase H-like nuclease (RuvC/YqgF family)
MYTLGTAAKATGKAKSTISKAIQDGQISAQKNENGSYTIEPSELHRVFPPVSANSPGEPQMDELEPFDLRFENGQLKGELKQIHERLAGIDTMHERERRALSDQIDDLRKRLDQSEQERREKDRQLTALLTDQTAQPAASSPQVSTGGGFLGLFRRRTV